MPLVIVYAFFVTLALALRRHGMRRQAPCVAALVSALCGVVCAPAIASALGAFASDSDPQHPLLRIAGFTVLIVLAIMASAAWDERKMQAAPLN